MVKSGWSGHPNMHVLDVGVNQSSGRKATQTQGENSSSTQKVPGLEVKPGA